MQFSIRTNGLASAIFARLETEKQKLLAAGREVIDLSTGTPDLPPPPHVIRVLQEESARPENFRYAIKDLPELIDTVAEWYRRRFQVSLERDEICSMMGSQDGLAHISLVLVDSGDPVLVPDPGYPIFSIGPFLANGKLYKTPLLKENGFLVDFERIEPSVAHQAKLIIVSYPSNPVTAMALPEFYEKLIWFAKKYEIAVVHDNAYCELVFDGKKGGSFLQFPGAKEVGVEFNSLSKTYNMPGCRISFAMGNKNIINQFRNLKSHLDFGVFLPIQKAAIAALNGPQDCTLETVRAYQNRRDLLVEGLNRIGWAVDKPPATMFVWGQIPERFDSSESFVFELMSKTGVMVVPGSSFGEMGDRFVRMALVQPEDKIRRALELIKASSFFMTC